MCSFKFALVNLVSFAMIIQVRLYG
jgi:hypothetical protein